MARGDELKQYRYLHFATHGKPDTERGLRSFLALSQDNLPDPLTIPEPGKKLFKGQLNAADILRWWKLDADLVVLSACETGLGQHQGGEGYVGFAQAFLLAGARTLVLSQWQVDDQATALLMQRFYQNLRGQRPGLEKPMPKAAALAEAKQWLRTLSTKEVKRVLGELLQAKRGTEVAFNVPVVETGDRPYEHPYYWGAFILIGDPGDVSQIVPVLAEPALTVQVPESSETMPWPWIVGIVLTGVALVCWWKFWVRRQMLPTDTHY